MNIRVRKWESPLGTLILGSYGNKICICNWAKGKTRTAIESKIRRLLGTDFEEGTSPVIENAIGQLKEYFSDRLKKFDLPTHPVGTDFQCLVWSELMHIPYGITISYAELARRIGNPKAVRAVGPANAMNPVSIIIPCHRVIGSDHKLTGYAGGPEIKQALLSLENPLFQSPILLNSFKLFTEC